MLPQIALRSLLLAGTRAVSTQQPVRPDAKAAPHAVGRALITAFWLWLVACPVIGLLAVASNSDRVLTGEAVAVAMGPAALGLLLFSSLGETWAAWVLIGAWLASATALIAAGGGAFSPLTASLLIAPALMRTIGHRWVAETAAAAVLCYALGAWLSPLLAMPGIAPFPPALAIAALAFAGGLMALAPPAPASPPPAAAPIEEALSQRVAEVSHELRTPLTHILGFAEILERELFGPIGERNVEYAGLIRRSGGHLLDLVNDLLDISKIEAGRYELELEDFDAREIVEEVVRLSADAAARKQITLEAQLPPEPLQVRADQRALRRMLINTLGNAVKFTPEGGRVVVAARAENGGLVLDTIDNGPGISPAERERLGRPYERGESGAHVEGTGLGLALVRELAVLHGGGLSFHDAPEGGALVRIDLPVLKT